MKIEKVIELYLMKHDNLTEYEKGVIMNFIDTQTTPTMIIAPVKDLINEN